MALKNKAIKNRLREIQEIKDYVLEGGFDGSPDQAFSFFIVDNCLEDIFHDEEYSANITGIIPNVQCSNFESFIYLVSFIATFLKVNKYMSMDFFNCYFRYKNKYGCKELKEKMNLIEEEFEENFDKIPLYQQKPEFFPKNYKHK